MKPWPKVRLSAMLTERREVPDVEAVALGTIRIVSKIGFDQGKIELRNEVDTKTGMILVRPGDLLLSGINAAKGAIAVYGRENGEPVAATIHYGAYEIRENRADLTYLWWYLRSAAFREILFAALPNGIKTELKSSRFLPIEIPLPPLAEQQRIVARIEALSAQIAEARSLRHQAAEEAEALLMSARRVVIAGCGASSVALEDTCAAIIDNLHSNPRLTVSGIPCIRSPDVGYGTLNLDDAQRTDEEEYRRRTVRGVPQADDIVLVREGGGTGKCAQVLTGQQFSLGQRVMMLRPNVKKILPRFFLHQLLSPLVQKEQIAPLSKGSASPYLNIGILRRFTIRLPSLNKQSEIVAYLDGLHAQVDALKQLQAEIAAELDALLPSIRDRAFKGGL